MPRPANQRFDDEGEEIFQGEPREYRPCGIAPGNRAVSLTDTEVIQARAGHRRTLAELNGRARVLGGRTLLANACNAMEAAQRLVAGAESEVKAAEAEELAAMRAAAEGGAK
jgi:hypothetical protein